MKQKRLLIILGAISTAILLVLVAAFPLIKGLLLPDATSQDQNVFKINLCDENASGLCIVTFGTAAADEMAIVFQLPGAEYPAFYVTAVNQGVENNYSCEAAGSPINVICVGPRTPLGELLDIQVYTTEGDLLIANGTFTLSSMATTLFNNNSGFGPMGKVATPTPSPSPTPSPTPTVLVINTSTPVPTAIITSTPDIAYPNP